VKGIVILRGIPLPAVLVDLETTGSPRHGKITEIGIIEIDEHEIRTWSTLVNPETEIPINIQYLTGITNEMVASAPRFEDIADEVFLKLKDKLFIAHNVGFDYGFLRKELGNLGITFKAPLMCSVKLSRTLYPSADSHSLENIIIRHKIPVQYRHRALDDAQATYQFLQIAESEHGVEKFRAAFHKQFEYGELPLGINPDIISAIPRTAGIYYLWDSDNKLLYIGKSNNIRTEVFAQFLSGEKSPLEIKLAALTSDITWEITPGELSAIILHAKKVTLLKPVLNKRAQIVDSLCSIFLKEDLKGQLCPQVVFADEIAVSSHRLYGLFATEHNALKEMKKLFLSNNLCFNNLPTHTSNALFACENSQCLLCNGSENHLRQNIRMHAAFEKIALTRWPFKTPIAIKESGKNCESIYIIVNNWCLLGIAKSMDELQELLSMAENFQLDRNVYKFLVRYFSKNHSKPAFKIIPHPDYNN
jgi:DNA polymerase-3 subunit epsilon